MTDTAVQRVDYPTISPAPRADDTTVRADVRAEIRGHAAGYTAGLRAAQAETEALRSRLEAEHTARLASMHADTARRIAVLDAATNALLSRTTPVLADAEASVTAAAVELAEAVVGYAIRASRPVDGLEGGVAPGVEATVERALASIDRSVAIAVRLSVGDAARVAGLDLPVPVVADPSLTDGDAVVDLPDGLLDARISTALDRARTALGVTR
ncbi:hypothetical protein [Curtobacterium sp. ISL-83]|uniref:FliH/SctL family protein n=1 Tax=Curtobacterium sp. ISL-83 TaxID=2819145 RepID=UPI001BE6FC57|nr:hypothetical protein [Curtobacterium sp. ISL-83]MBT2501015.1 hypothetical protein [Curtobacterium sp. ISL-83]